jgi:hypothetical protein
MAKALHAHQSVGMVVAEGTAAIKKATPQQRQQKEERTQQKEGTTP